LSSSADAPAAAYDGVSVDALAVHLGVARLALYARVHSTMDVAHALAAAGAPHATLVLADAQVGGRGRARRRWASPLGTGVWATWIARPERADALDVLSLRVGLALAARLDALAPARVRIKWPNDLLLAPDAHATSPGGKLAGVLVEARWRDTRPEWVAVGVGINVRPPRDASRRGPRARSPRRSWPTMRPATRPWGAASPRR
jgi:BirA family biotin operon repressor/biotin-[acetyl-CoA-carboxylase] ligase